MYQDFTLLYFFYFHLVDDISQFAISSKFSDMRFATGQLPDHPVLKAELSFDGISDIER